MKHFISSLDGQFARLHEQSLALLEVIAPEQLYLKPRKQKSALPVYSCGEYLLRSAGAVEQTFGGITTNLWDDPFEWTLPETLSSAGRVAAYLHEVEETRRHGFDFFSDDADLLKEIAMPSGEPQTLYKLLLETLARASHYQGRAFATLRFFSDARTPRV